MTTLGFIGLGNMGAPMAASLQRGGHTLVVYDANPAAGAELAGADVHRVTVPVHVAEAAHTVLLSLPGPPEVRAVVEKLMPRLRADDVVIDLSTCSPALADEVAPRLAERGARFVDAPVTGGVPAANAATLKLMVGADEALFERVKPLLDLIGNEVLRMGPTGKGYAAKLVKNVLGFVHNVAVMEGLELADAAGVDMDAMVTLLQAKSLLSTSGAPSGHVFRVELGAKDTRLAVELAAELGVSWDIGRKVYQVLNEAVAQGHGGENMAEYTRRAMAERWLSVQV